MSRIKKQQEEEKEKPVVRLVDIQELIQKRANYKQKRMGLRLYSPTDQWLMQMGIISLKDDEIVVHEPDLYTFWTEVDEARKNYEYKQAVKDGTYKPVKLEAPKHLIKKMPVAEEDDLIPF